MKREITWKQAYDLKVAENEQLRRDGSTKIDKVMAENKRKRQEWLDEIERLRAALLKIEGYLERWADEPECGEFYEIARSALEPKP